MTTAQESIIQTKSVIDEQQFQLKAGGEMRFDVTAVIVYYSCNSHFFSIRGYRGVYVVFWFQS